MFRQFELGFNVGIRLSIGRLTLTVTLLGKSLQYVYCIPSYNF